MEPNTVYSVSCQLSQGINDSVLTGGDPSEISIAQRMSWASKRVTTRVEDVAYCLLGLFNVNMPLLYGEGMKAFQRLQEEIIRQSNDQSIFAWHNEWARGKEMLTGLLATSPLQFKSAGNIFSYCAETEEPYLMTNKGLNIQLPMRKDTQNGFIYRAALACYSKNESSGLVVLTLEHLQDDQFARWSRAPLMLEDLQTHMRWEKRTIFVKQTNVNGGSREMLGSVLIRLRPPHEGLTRLGFRLVAVSPSQLWNGSCVTLPEDTTGDRNVVFVFQRCGQGVIVNIDRLHYIHGRFTFDAALFISRLFDARDADLQQAKCRDYLDTHGRPMSYAKSFSWERIICNPRAPESSMIGRGVAKAFEITQMENANQPPLTLTVDSIEDVRGCRNGDSDVGCKRWLTNKATVHFSGIPNERLVNVEVDLYEDVVEIRQEDLEGRKKRPVNEEPTESSKRLKANVDGERVTNNPGSDGSRTV